MTPDQTAAFIVLAAIALVSVGWWAASVLRARRVLVLDEATETVSFTQAADEAVALTLPVVEPPVFDAMMRTLPLNEAIWLMPNALGDEVEAWLQEGAAS